MTDGFKGSTKNTEQPRGLLLIPEAQIKLILTVADSFLCVLQNQTMISSDSHHKALGEASGWNPVSSPASSREGRLSLYTAAKKGAVRSTSRVDE